MKVFYEFPNFGDFWSKVFLDFGTEPSQFLTFSVSEGRVSYKQVSYIKIQNVYYLTFRVTRLEVAKLGTGLVGPLSHSICVTR